MNAPRFLICSMLVLSSPGFAQFSDQGFTNAIVRTDYNSQTEGLSSNPVTYVSPCYFSTAPCGNSPTVFSSTNWFVQNGSGYPQLYFWVLGFNNEDAYNKPSTTTHNPGPPNQSIPRSAPGYGLMGFTAIKNSLSGENFFRAHLVLNGTFPNPNFDGTPFMSIGGERTRGNGVTPGYINSASGYKRVKFKARLWDFKLPTKVYSQTVPTQDPSLEFYMYAITSWGEKRRGLFVVLSHWMYETSDATSFIGQVKWNWPMLESVYYPGVEWAYIDAEDVISHCGFSVPRLTTVNQQISYDINLHSLFRCLGSSSKNGWDTPIPTTQVLSINGVHWAVEMTGENGWIWPSVHDMEMSP